MASLTFAPEAWIFESQLLDLHGMTASLVAQTILVAATPDEVILATNSAHRFAKRYASEKGCRGV